jgi:hypothetical protein
MDLTIALETFILARNLPTGCRPQAEPTLRAGAGEAAAAGYRPSGFDDPPFLF